MNSKLTIILIIFFQLLFLNKIFSKEIQFNANEIEVLDGGNETIAKNGTAFIEKDKISVTGAIIKYKKNKSLLIINEGEIKKIDDNLKINSIVSFHPAYLLRQPDQKKFSWIDLKMIREKLLKFK